MGITVRATVTCDVRRTPGCHERYTAAADSRPVSVFAVMAEAEACGWATEDVPGRLGRRDACPACTATRRQREAENAGGG